MMEKIIEKLTLESFITQTGRYFAATGTLGKDKYWISHIDNPESIHISWDKESVLEPSVFNHTQITNRLLNGDWFFIETEQEWLVRKFRQCKCGFCRQWRSNCRQESKLLARK